MVKLSIGLPFFNNEFTLGSAIRSVFAQTFQDWELILVDDGSRDRSLKIASSVDDPRVRVVADGVNRGIAARLNQITAISAGELLARMDADDMMHPERLARQVQLLEDKAMVDVVCTGVFSIDRRDRVIGVRGDSPLDVRPEAVLEKGLLCHPTVVGRRSWFIANPYDEEFVRAQDRELWCRTAAHTSFAKIARPLLFYREDRVALKNYLANQRAGRAIVARYGPQLVGFRRARKLRVASYAKAWAYLISYLFGVDRLLIQRRSRRLSPSEVAEAGRCLRVICDTVVPGMISRIRATVAE